MKYEKLVRIKECLVNQWEYNTPQELTNFILRGENEDAVKKDLVHEMVLGWVNNEENVRLNYQLAEYDAENDLNEFINKHLSTK
jgi:hypothetical protein